jgi:hypothetical protein
MSKSRTDPELWDALEKLGDDVLNTDFPTSVLQDELRKIGGDALALARRGAEFVASLQDKHRLAWKDEAHPMAPVLETIETVSTSPVRAARCAEMGADRSRSAMKDGPMAVHTSEVAIAELLDAGGYRPDPDYCQLWQVALRRTPGGSVCCDPDCDLSGGYAHAGDCEPCTCGKEHATVECPERWCFTCEAPKSERRILGPSASCVPRVAGTIGRPS